MANNQQVENISIQDRGPQNTAADWVRQLRFSNDVNKSTVGVDTDRVTPQLLVAASKKLLGISRGTQKGDAKDSMRYQKVFGPVEYFAQHIQRDGGSVARQMLWKATNKGNLDFISTGSLQPHISSVFNQSNLTRFIDNSTPLDGIDNSMLLTRLGQGGISSEDSAPIQMRLVQPSYYGYVGPARSQEKSPGITAYMTKNVIRGTDGKLYQKMLNARTGKQQLVDSQKAASSIVTTNQILNTKDKYVYAMGGDSGVQIVPRSSVDYILPRADDAYSMAANAVPMLSGVKSMRLLMGCLHPQTPVPFVDENGFTDIVPAKRLGNYGDAYLSSCDKKGKETLVKLSKVVSRFSDFTRPFKRVVTSSGRVLITSPDHKWYIKKGQQFTKVTADKLQTGMIVPRSLFTKLPYKVTTILGVQITKQICVLIGRLLKSFQQTSKIYRFSYIKNQMFDQQADIEKAFQQLNVVGCNHYVRDNIHYVSISDQRLLDWIQTEIHLQLNERKVPKSILSLPVGFTSQVIDSYCKQGDNVGQDMFGDAWLLDIPSVEMRDGLALMLGKLYSDTLYRDSYSNGRPQRALKAIPVKYSQNVVLQTIVKITDQPAPAFMVDIDCDDNVYAVGNGIITHNSKYALQAVPLQQPQAPLVRSLDQATGKDMDTLLGRLVGTQWAQKPGVVKAVRKDRIDMLYDDGTTGSIDLYQNFPANAKGWISNYPMVKAGDRVAKDQLLAKSNYSDDNGVCAMGRNLRVGYLSYHGGTYEDACVISQTAAKKMGYTTMYKTGMDLDKTIRNSKSLYNTWKPGQYSKQQMQNLDEHGVVKVGAKLNKGDPMILGIRSIEPSPGTMGKRLLTDVTQTWDHEHQGIVTDVVQTKNGIKVYAKVSAPLQVGDKISQRYGGKATIAQILPDQQMPRDAKDRPLQLLFDPLGVVSRCYDKQTKFLTKHGWKNGDQVQYDQQLYIYDPETDTCRWGRQLQPMHKSFYRGIMYGAKNKQVDFLVTPNHTMWARTQPKGSKFHRCMIQDIHSKRYIVPSIRKPDLTAQSTQYVDFQLPSLQAKTGRHTVQMSKRISFRAQHWASFLGWYLSQGNTTYDQRACQYKVHISQSKSVNPSQWLEIQNLLDAMGVPYHYNQKNIQFHINGKRIAHYLKQFGKCDQKFIPQYIKQAPLYIKHIFLDSILKGDGRQFYTKNGVLQRSIALTSHRLIQQLHVLCTQLGYRSVIRNVKPKDSHYKKMWRLSISEHFKDYNLRGTNWYTMQYSDYVYCPTVQTGYVVTSRNSKVLCAGNTNPSQMIQVALGKVAQKTGKPVIVPQFMQPGQSRLKWAKEQLKKYNIPWKQNVYDPQTGKTVKDVFTGKMYFLPLKHIADTKMSARGTDQYTAQGIPGGKGQTGCFPAMQNVWTIHGQRSIATICQKRIPQYVMSWDQQAKQWCWKQITDWFTYRAKTEDILNIFTDNAISTYGGHANTRHTTSSYPTKNHKMYMADGSVKLAGQLKVGDYLAGVGTQYTEDQMQALYGTLMGDSCRSSDMAGIQCMHSQKQYYYINYKRSIFAAVGAGRVSQPMDVPQHTIKAFSGKQYAVKGTAVRMQIPKSYYTQKALQLTTDSAGKRHLTIPVLQAMGQFGFCLWFLDDGSMHNHTKHKGKAQPQARIATHSFSVEQVQEAAKWLQKNLLHVENGTSITLYKGIHGQDQPCLNFRREASWQIARIIAKHIPWQVIPKSKMWLRSYCQQIQQKTPCVRHNFNSPLGIVPLKVKQIKPYKHDKPNVTQVNVYDFTVQNTHNYALSGGVRVSNSKRLGGLESAALVGHNAFNFLQDAKVIRGQANSQFWRSLRTGQIPVMPGQPLVHKKFFAHLQGAGMRIRKTTKGVSIMALTNQDVNQLAGSRQLKSKDTYQQKTFREIDGGLFGKDIFGTQGDRWGYIQLDEPLPNPVMQQPLAKLLRISDKQFQAVVAGKQQVNGMKNAADIKAALQKIDLKSQKSKALAQLKQATPSKRDAALKRYVAIAQMQANGSSPADYMLDRIPVLPPNFRPISTQGGLTMVADSNYLYAQLLDARDDAREAKALPQQYQDQARANIYRKWKQLVGLYDPQSKKLQAKDVKGLLRWALGKTPKFSAVQRKVIGSTVDTVGRGVVVPDSHLKLNEIGLPQSIAWNIYSPFVTRRLVMGGYTPVDAMKLVKGHSQAAKELLLQQMQQRPVVMNRAPSLHKLSLMGFWPKMTTGYAIKVPPSIVSPFGMDFDGDSILNTVQIYADQDAFLDICQKHQKKDLTFQKSVLYYIQHQKKGMLNMISNNTQVRLIHTVCSLADIPTVEGSEVQKSPTVTEWDVKGNIFVGTVDPATGEKTVARMTKVSKHTGLNMYDCTLSTSGAYSHVVTASEDHSLITLNPSTLELEKTKPAEAKGRCVPRMMCDGVTEEPYVQRWITLDKPYPMSYELGMFFGLMIGDGWVDSMNFAKIACCEESLQKYILELTQPKRTMPFTKQARLGKYAPSEGRFSDNTMDRFEVYMSEEDKKALASYIGKGAYNKRIPFMSFYGSKAHLLGILCGLLATDGHIGISSTSSKKAAIKNIAYHTTSPLLKDDIQLLCNKLGVRTRATPYMGANSKATCYEIGFCLEDIAKLKKEHPDLFVVPVDYKEEALKEICKDIRKGVKNSFDLVPFPRGLFCEFSYAKAAEIHKNSVVAARAKGYIRRDHAKDIADVMEKIEWADYQEPTYLKLSDRTNHTPEQAKELVQKWIKIVRDTDVTWELVESVTPSTSTEGWDCTVPGPYTFTLSTGTVVQDTVNIHVPVSKAAVKDVIQKMMPERNLISARKHQILYPPEKAFTQGIYVATRMGQPKPGGIQTFNSLQQAKEAYKKGLIDIDTPIDIKDKR